MPFFSGAQHSETTGGVFTDVAGDYNSLSVTGGLFTDVTGDHNSLSVTSPNITVEGSSGGRGGNSASHITLNLSAQGALDPSVHRRDDLNDPSPWFAMGSEQSPSDIYSRLLLPKRHGFPLWFPEPRKELSSEYRSVGVEIGDVGMITFDGGFDFLFNICRPADDPVNSQGVPAGFEPVHLKPEHVREISDMHSVGAHISSACIYTAELRGEDSNNLRGRPTRFCGGLKFECSDSMGAVLVLPEGGFRKDLLAKRLFLQYAMRNAAAWYQFATGPDLGREAENGSLYLVTGCDKSPAWGVASYYHPSGSTRVSFKFMTVGEGDDDASLVYSWEDYSPATVRMSCQDRSRLNEARHLPSVHGHEYDGLNPRPTFNQCAFIRGFRISLAPRYMGWLLGEKVKIEEGINPIDSSPSSSPSSTRASLAPQVLTHSGSPSVYGRQNSNQRMDAVSECDPNVLLEDISGMSSASPYHPLVSINKYLLESAGGSKIAITHDDDWHALLDDSDSKLPEDAVLIQRLAKGNIRQDGDVVYLAFQDQNTSIASRESPHWQEHPQYLIQLPSFAGTSTSVSRESPQEHPQYLIPLPSFAGISTSVSRESPQEHWPYLTPLSSFTGISTSASRESPQEHRHYLSPLSSFTGISISASRESPQLEQHQHYLFPPSSFTGISPSETDSTSCDTDDMTRVNSGVNSVTYTLCSESTPQGSPLLKESPFSLDPDWLRPSSQTPVSSEIQADWLIPSFMPQGSPLFEDSPFSLDPLADWLRPSIQTPVSSAILIPACKRRKRDARYQCSFCPQILNSRDNLISHEDIHNNIKRFPCVFCNRRFRTRAVLNRHQRGSRCRMSRMGPHPEVHSSHPSTDPMKAVLGTPQALEVTHSSPGFAHTPTPIPTPLTPIQGALAQHTVPTRVQRFQVPSPDYGGPSYFRNNTTDPDV